MFYFALSCHVNVYVKNKLYVLDVDATFEISLIRYIISIFCKLQRTNVYFCFARHMQYCCDLLLLLASVSSQHR